MNYSEIAAAPERYNHFIMQHPYGSYYQTTYYAEAEKANGFTDYVYVTTGQEDEIKAACLFKLKPIPHTPWYYAFSRMGFVLDYGQSDWREEAAALWESMLRELKAHKVIYFRFDLPVTEDREEVYAFYREKGAGHKPLSDDNSNYTYFRFRAFLDIDQDEKSILKNMHSSNRQDFRKSQKYGLVLRKGGLEDIPIYQKLKDETGERNHISSHTLEEARLIFSEMQKGGTADLYLVKLVPDKTLDVLQQDKQRRKKEIEKAKNKKRPNPNHISDLESAVEKLERQIAEVEALKATKPEGMYLCAGMTFGHGDTLDYLYAGSSSAFRDFLPNYLMIRQMIIDGKEKGYKYLDMGGTDAESNPTPLSAFKTRWGCETRAYSGDFDYILKKPWGNIFRCLLNKKEAKENE